MSQKAFSLWWTCALFLAFAAHTASGQTLRTRAEAPTFKIEETSPWAFAVRYSVETDYADTAAPRGYTNAVFTSLGYQFTPNWSFTSEAGARGEFFDGQIDKDQQESYSEVVSASTSFELDYEDKFWGTDSYSMSMHGEPLWDQASIYEGYKGLVGAGASVNFNFYHKTFTIGQALDATELLNTFKYASDTTANPDYFVTYKLANSIRFWGAYKLSYIFGLKTTRYLDGFWGYNYQNTFALSRSWGHLTVAVAYDNGGWTDDGTVSLWFIDEYRRLGRFAINYTF
jgi:hypothetical protein